MTEYTDKMLVVLAPATVQNKQAGIPKSIVPDLRWFDRDRTKFEDQQREIRLFLKSNRVIRTDNRITTILVQLRGSIAGIYAQKKLDQLKEKMDTQNQDKFVRELRMIFSNKSKTADAEQKIETFKQSKKHIVNFIIKFEILVMKAETNDLHIIFLLKKNVQMNIIKTILGYPPIAAPETLRE